MDKLKLCLIGLICLIGTIGYGEPVFCSAKTFGADDDVIKIKLKDGTEVSAAFFDGAEKQVVVSVPGGLAGKENYYFLAKRLQKINVASLLLDGRSENDLLSAIDFLKQKNFEKIVLVGGSIGAGTILTTIKYTLTETQKALIEKIILIGPYSGSALQTNKIKKLFIAAKSDSVSPLSGIRELYEDTSEPKILKLYEGPWHAEQLFESKYRDDVARTIIDFIQ